MVLCLESTSASGKPDSTDQNSKTEWSSRSFHTDEGQTDSSMKRNYDVGIDFCGYTLSSAGPNTRSPRPRLVMGLLRLTITVCALSNIACGNPHALLQLAAPSSVTASSRFTVTVTAIVNGNRDTIINSRIQFTSSDPAADLPTDYFFTAADAGSHTFTNGFALLTSGNHTISAKIFDANGINGSVTIAVVP
jgi:hypothetical protein